MSESWVSGPPEPTRAERESAEEWLREDAIVRRKRLLNEVAAINETMSELADLRDSERCVDALSQIEAEYKQNAGRLATCEAELNSIQNQLEGR